MTFRNALRGFAYSVVAAAAAPAASAQTPELGQGAGRPVLRAPAAPRPVAPAPFKPEKLPANVVARVNGQNITRTQTLSLLASLGGQPLLREMITSTVLEQEAKKQGVVVTDAEVAQEIAKTKQQFPAQALRAGNPMTFSEYAAREGISEGLLRWSVRRRLLGQKTYRKTLENQIKAPDLTGQISVSHILVATVPVQTAAAAGGAKAPTDDEAKKKIEAIRADIVAGKTTFAAAAAKNSDDPGSKVKGGSLGFFAKNGQFLKEFEDAAFALKKPGDISEPFKTQYGYHIVRLDKTQATAADRAALRAQLIQQTEQNQGGFNAWLTGLMQGAKVSLNPAAMTGGAASTSSAAK